MLEKLNCWFRLTSQQYYNTGAIDVKIDRSALKGKSSFKILGLMFSSKLDEGSYVISILLIAETASKKIGALICSMKSLSPVRLFCSYLFINLPYDNAWNVLPFTYFFEPPSPPPSYNFLLFYFTPWNSRQNKASTPGNSAKLRYTTGKFQGQKPRPLEIPHDFFLVTPGNSTSFLINLWKFHMLFLWYPWKFHIFNPLPCLFVFLE